MKPEAALVVTLARGNASASSPLSANLSTGRWWETSRPGIRWMRFVRGSGEIASPGNLAEGASSPTRSRNAFVKLTCITFCGTNPC